MNLITDPCASYSTLDNVKRSAGYALDLDTDIAISDDRLDPGWYRIVSVAGEDIPTEPPETFRCGSWYPIWLNGTLPLDVNSDVSQPVCIKTLLDECESTWNIDIRRCSGDFLVYNLLSSQKTKSAYCFGTDVKCPDGEYSETGYSPNCSSNVPPETFLPVVQAELAEGATLNPNIGPSLEPVFKCSFTEVSGQTYVYDVYWFINDQSIVTHRRLEFSNIDQALLRPNDWVGNYQMNMVVKCAVRARLNANSVPGPVFYSELFEAGVKPDNYNYQIIEGQEIAIPFISSVPVGCIGSSEIIMKRCTHTLKVSQPEYQNRPEETCTSNIEPHSLAFDTQDCGITLSTTSWNDPVYLNVTGYVDNVYNSRDRTANIRIETGANSATDLSGVWNTVNIPDIQVVVSDLDSAVTSRKCVSWNDPQYTTADGRQFWYHGSGEFILYKHKKYPYWVHTLTTTCPRGSCNCGFAVRSHDSLFVIRTCDVIATEFYASGRYYPSISYAVCDNKHMVIEKTSRGYKVTLPIGTEINIHMEDDWIPLITLKPSVLDIEQSEGICGFISQDIDSSDDLVPRGSTSSISSTTEFAKSWKVDQNSEEELFSPFPNFSREDLFLKEYCICASEAGHNDDISEFTSVHCNQTAPMIQCKTTRTPLAERLYQECHTTRRKRDTSDMEPHDTKILKSNGLDSDDILEEKTLTYDANYNPDYLPPDPVWRNGWSEESARQACTNGLSEMPALALCQMYGHLVLSDYIESCVIDVKIAGSTEFLRYTIWLMEDACKYEINRNESLFTSSSGIDGISVLQMIQNLLCPSNCSNHGHCNKTECVCYDGYIGSDCSTSISEPPREITVPDEGLCRTKSRACKKTNIFGVFHTPDVYCKFQHFTIAEDGKHISGSTHIKTAVFSFDNMISCEFPESSRKRRSTSNDAEGYDIYLSYDQINYGDSVTVILFPEDCLSCNVSTLTCVQVKTCPPDTDTPENKDTKSSTPPTAIIAVIIALVVFLTIVSVLVWMKYKKSKERIQRRNNNQSDHSIFAKTGIHNENSPPCSTGVPIQYRKDTSDLSIAWTERNASPVDLFRANS
ncbi:von Willebrand factor D and EGF domain-containing protein-like [Mytilus edulis]|uniref:von Willebrand factor D and EGF domain-containing protein-like n=1 Tax=Mytilus edulis TaxID=6550 RepID=UPI0039F058A1